FFLVFFRTFFLISRNSRLHRFFFSFVSSSVLIKTSSSESTSFILGMNGLKRKRPFTGGGVSSRTRTRKAVSNRNEPVREESNPVRGMTVVSLSLDTESEGMSVVSSKVIFAFILIIYFISLTSKK
ncbi:unnamed protein product, partial [Brassica oleracea]